MIRVACVVGLLVVGCAGGDEPGPELLEQVADGGSLAVESGPDAGTPATVDAAAAPPVQVPASMPTDAAARADAGSTDAGTVLVRTLGTCRAGEQVGALIESRCVSPAELEARRCALVGVTEAGRSTGTPSRTQLEQTALQIVVRRSGRIETHLCSEPTILPGAGWSCASVLVSSCTDLADQRTCRLPYIGTPVPTHNLSCAM